MTNGGYDNKTTEAVWVRTEILNSLIEPSTPPKLYGGRKRRLIPSVNSQGKSQNERSNNHKQTDWGWVFGHIIAFTPGTKKSSPHRHSEKTTVRISDSSSPFDGKTFELPSKKAFVMANTDDPDNLTVINDLVLLTHLHEPAIISSLKKRYARDEIYTATGPILLALNPFKRCPDLYSQHIMDLYSQDINTTTHSKNSKKEVLENDKENLEDSSIGSKIEEGKHKNTPHVFATAHRAFQNMSNFSKNLQQEQHTNQSVLVSGESGAGKTMTTKFVMQYLAYLSQLSHNKANIGQPHENVFSTPKKRNTKSIDSKKVRTNTSNRKDEDVGIEQQVLQSNPILESFGNARTIRNDNSSRFGKFIEIQFHNSSKSTYASTPSLAGASIKTYLLEKVRLITHARGERNYHIFYEILKGANETERENFFLYDLTPEDFSMTNCSGTFSRRDGVEDTTTFKDLKTAMKTMGFSKEEQFNILALVCSLLHASNITFMEKKDKSSEASQMEPSNPFVGAAVTLLGVSAKSLNKALCTCAIEAGGERLMKFLTFKQASKALEAFIKATYSALFEYIVHAINHSIASKNHDTYQNEDVDETMFIGVLDIFGFESFAVNSFEQLCINYCNESLQQQFNKFIFKLEQEEYEREGIHWSFIEFPDNQNVLDLIDKKHTGILSILDEQCRLAKCTDQSFAKSLHDKCSTHDCYHSTATQRVSGLFSVNHYAGPVEYSTYSFLEKNKDELPKEATELLQSSSNPFISELAEFLNRPQNAPRNSYVSSDSSVCSSSSANSCIKNNKRNASSLSRASVGSQFGSQLRDLLKRVNHTTPHYIRCLKPNDDLVPDNFDCNIIADQLRCAGVLEAVRVSRVGYPQRYTYASFIQRYKILSLKELKRIPKFQRIKSCEVLVRAVSSQIRRDCSNLKMMEDTKYATKNKDGKSCPKLTEVGIEIGKTKVFLRQIAFDSLERLRTQKLEISAIKMQAAVRMFISETMFKKKISSIIIIQCCRRRHRAQKFVQNMRYTNSAIKIQNSWRKLQCERNIRAKYVVAFWLQRYYRGKLARKLFKRLNMQRKATTIQTFWRKAIVLANFKKIYRSILTIQCFYRQRQSYFVLLSLRRDAKDLKKVVQERDLLRLEVKELKLKLEETKLECKGDFEGKHEFEPFQDRNNNISGYTVDNSFIENSSPKDHASFDTLILREEVERLKNELESSRTAKIVYRDFPSDPTDQETALIRFSRMCMDQDREIKALKEENKALRASLKNYESSDGPITHSVNNYPKGVNEDNEGSLPKESEHYSIKKMFRRKKGRSVLSNSYNDDGDDNSTVSSMFTPQKILSQLGPLNAFLGRPSVAEETRSSPLSRHFDASYREQKNTDVEVTSTISRGLDEMDTFSAHNELCSDVNDHQSTCPSVLSSSFMDVDGKGTLLHQSIKDLDHVGLGQALDDSDDVQRDINTGDNKGRTPLHLAALHSSSQMVSVLLDKFAVTNCQDHHGNTPLHYATDMKTIEILLDKGARPNIPNEHGLCALHLAVQRGDLFAVKTLIKNGADVDAADNIKWYTPLHLITQLRSESSTQDESQDKHDTSVLCQIAEYICSIKPKPDMNFQDKDGNTPLHHSAALEKYDAYFLSKLLLKNGCNPNISNKRGQTPLHLLCHNVALRRFEFYQDFFRLFLSSGADSNASSQSGCTPLHLAVFHHDIDSAVQLVNHGAQLHHLWIKPSHLEPFWDNEESSEILALDMITDENSMYRVLSSVQYPQQWAPPRQSCMQCKVKFSPFVRQHHCRKCGRIVCGQCSPKSMDPDFFPKSFKSTEFIGNGPCRVCVVCEEIILSELDESRSSS